MIKSLLTHSLSALALLGLTLGPAHANRKVAEVDYEKYAQYMGPYFKESREDFQKRMQWFDEADRGMFIHFGLYSHLGGNWGDYEVSGNITEWIWARVNREVPAEDYNYQAYMDLVNTWNPQGFDAKEVVALAKELGMDYITITTKHHEGFCLWPSEYTEFDIDSTPMKGRDIIGELAEACKAEGVRLGLYYSITDWHRYMKHQEAKGKINPQAGGGWALLPADHDGYFEYMKNQLTELVEKYDPDLFWFDGDWAQTFLTYERGYELYEHCRGLKPSILVNERCFSRRFPDMPKKDFGNLEHTAPSPELIEKQQDPERRLYYEYCNSTQTSWGHDRRTIQGTNMYYTPPSKMLGPYAMMKRMYGNYLLNFGPDENGKFDPIAVKAARDFAKAADKLDQGGDYSGDAVNKVLQEMNFNKADYKNPNHLSFTNPEAYERVTQTGNLSKQITKNLGTQKKEGASKELESELKELKKTATALIQASSEANDPIQVRKRMEALERKLAELPE